jgi:hypothetical protein
MTRRFHRGLATVYALAVTAALGFGSKEATATPAENAALACTLAECGQYCTDQGFDYGKCTQYGCQCYIRMCGSAPC